LLTGDIGSGKSTILLAIEFALFGFLRGEVSGSALLRHGSNSGSVEMEFEIENKQVIIQRTLKRAKDRIEQDSSSITINGVKTEATTLEIKTIVLDLLGYPKDLLTKSKGLIYRYTVYTPQEEMKKILYEDDEARINVLRKIFDVEKYKRVRENSTVYVRNLVEKIKRNEGFILDIEQKRIQLQQKQIELENVKAQITSHKSSLEQTANNVLQIKTLLQQQEKEITQVREMKQIVAVSQTQKTHKTDLLNRLSRELEIIRDQIKNLQIDDFSEQNYQEILRQKEKEFSQMQEEMQAYYRAISEFSTHKHHSDTKIKNLLNLNQCPTCFQEVQQIHKNSIADVEQKKSVQLQEEIKKRESFLKEKNFSLEKLRKEIENLRLLEKKQSQSLMNKRIFDEKQKRSIELEQNIVELKKDLKELDFRITALTETLTFKLPLEEQFQNTRKELDSAFNIHNSANMIHVQLVEKEKHCSQLISDVLKDLSQKELAKLELEKLNKRIMWIEDFFVPLTETIEKQVMARVHGSFNELFRTWFSMLLEDENISSRLDENFSPLLQQNGYDTGLENLSGGEKTACALAYRLALNSVINNLVSTIKTKKLLILDEPTDGFSSEQLDKMRDVLDQLGCRQTLIVSHESKIEGMVDNVIRIGKEEHRSEVSR
ncbi:MAG: AAA family ATPase, partial [Nanoarchaeota archaeon]